MQKELSEKVRVKIITISGVAFYEGDEIEYYTNTQAHCKGDRRAGKLVWNKIGYSVDTRIGCIDEYKWHVCNPIKIQNK